MARKPKTETPVESTALPPVVDQQMLDENPALVGAGVQVGDEISTEGVDFGDSVTVTFNGGSRVYTRKIHGEDFVDLAFEFAGKQPGRVVSPTK
jgi:hypothetical protein